MALPAPLTTLIAQLRKLPGVGRRTAERFAYTLLELPNEQRDAFVAAIQQAPQKLAPCSVCQALKERAVPCGYCDSGRRDSSLLCIVSSWKDLFAIEATGEYRGLYHVLSGTLSPLEGRGPEDIAAHRLLPRLEESGISEVVIAIDSTLEGDATALYLKELLARFPVAVTRLAFGLPMGSALDYVDGSTLTRAFLGRGKL